MHVRVPERRVRADPCPESGPEVYLGQGEGQGGGGEVERLHPAPTVNGVPRGHRAPHLQPLQRALRFVLNGEGDQGQRRAGRIVDAQVIEGQVQVGVPIVQPLVEAVLVGWEQLRLSLPLVHVPFQEVGGVAVLDPDEGLGVEQVARAVLGYFTQIQGGEVDGEPP